MWIVVTLRPEDSKSWGLKGRIGKVGAGAGWSPWSTSGAAPTPTSELCVLNGSRLDEKEHQDEAGAVAKWTESLDRRVVKVWIHFGGENSPNLTQAKIQAAWKGVVGDRSWLKGLESAEVMPFSMTTGTSWDRALQAVAKLSEVGEGAEEAVGGLASAWKAAKSYYELTRPLGDFVAALFPLAIEIEGIAESENSNERGSAWWAEAREDFAKRASGLTDQTLLVEESRKAFVERAGEVLKEELPAASGTVTAPPLTAEFATSLAMVAGWLASDCVVPGVKELRGLGPIWQVYRILEQHYAT